MSKRAAAVKQRIQQFYFQLTDGCGRSNCANPDCASNPSFVKLTSDEAAARAMILFKNKIQLCDKPSVKVPRTDSEEDEINSTGSTGNSNLVTVENSKDDFNFTSQHLFKEDLNNDQEVAKLKAVKQSSKSALSSNHEVVHLKEQSNKTTKSSVTEKEQSLDNGKVKLSPMSNLNDSSSANSPDENINKKLSNIFVSKPTTAQKSSKSQESGCFCKTIGKSYINLG